MILKTRSTAATVSIVSLIAFTLLVSVSIHSSFGFVSVYSQASFGIVWNLPKYIPVSSEGITVKGSNIFIKVINHADTEYSFETSSYVKPNNKNISVIFNPTTFSVKPHKEVTIYFELRVSQNIFPGTYNLTITITGTTTANGNTIQQAQEYHIQIIVTGEKTYKVEVYLKQPDGSPVYGVLRVAYIYEDTVNYIYEDMGAHITLNLVKGKYKFEAIFEGVKKVEKEVFIDKDMSFDMIFSLIYISDVEIQNPKDAESPLSFKFKLVNEDDFIFRKSVEILCSLFDKENNIPITSNMTIAKLVISGKSYNTLFGLIDPPSEPNNGWYNGTFILTLVAKSNKEILYKYSFEFSLVVVSPKPMVIVKNVGMPPELMIFGIAGGIAVGTMTQLLLNKKLRKQKEIPRIVPPIKIGLWSQIPRVIYNIVNKNYEDVHEKVLTSRILPLNIIIEVAYTNYWANFETAIPVSMAVSNEKYVFYPITKKFALFLVFPPYVYEYDEKIIAALRNISKLVKEILHEFNINEPEELDLNIEKFKDRFQRKIVFEILRQFPGNKLVL